VGTLKFISEWQNKENPRKGRRRKAALQVESLLGRNTRGVEVLRVQKTRALDDTLVVNWGP